MKYGCMLKKYRAAVISHFRWEVVATLGWPRSSSKIAKLQNYEIIIKVN